MDTLPVNSKVRILAGSYTGHIGTVAEDLGNDGYVIKGLGLHAYFYTANELQLVENTRK